MILSKIAMLSVGAAMKTLWQIVMSATLASVLCSEGQEYAGWTVGNLWTDGNPTILRSTDSGVSWSRQGIGQVADVNMSGVLAVDPLSAWVVGDPDSGYATIYHTTNGGLTWNRMGSAAQVPNTQLRKVAIFGDSNVWAVGDGTILHSGDGGTTWANQVPAGYESFTLQGVYTPDGINVWATGSNSNASFGVILYSSNGGLTWTPQTGGDVGLMRDINGISGVDANSMWAMGGCTDNFGTIVLSTSNGGATWTQQYKTVNGDGNNIYAVNSQTVWAVADTAILLTTNGGTIWTNSVTTPDYTMGISAVDAQQAWAVNYGMFGGGTIMRTTNGGTDWVSFTNLDGETLPDLFTVSFSPTVIPEPSSVLMLALGLAALWGRRHR